ncbi:L-threonylcarbamoyladenylate synthase [Pontivivens insulae]|uniref:Threonylcarbamoyl-AMP synthase n=1 Tax=Pontivivens insulae TaxID=1639689 RepID=A0A2R8A7Q2_9RHOB|nr:L-threonylcarbamoyladenylate synthase [Pontivivens insulae]RED18318.1 translation factor SUA5 [Pontivivens insulae]SPF28216.1 Threonylcarbamoyl-AMP synthase [Pontivivens insulae]
MRAPDPSQAKRRDRSEQRTERLFADEAGIKRAADLILSGKTVSFATETVYGLGADATNSAAVAAIYAAKERPQFNPLIAHVADVSAADALVCIPPALEPLISDHWPGPLTLVLPKKSDMVSDLVTAGLSTLAVRVPARASARAMLRAVNRPVAAPSANPSGRISPTTADHVLSGLDGKIAAVLDDGPCDVGLESTILGWEDGPVLLRAGGLSVEAIETALNCSVRSTKGEAITAPGQLLSHYAPQAALRLNATQAEPEELLLRFGDGPSDWTLSPTGDLTEAAANLFAMLHRADRVATRIAVMPIPQTGLGLAINDRLNRAAAPR